MTEDANEHRKIRNRLAQRRYRQNLKRRIEDLESRAAEASSPAPNGVHNHPRPGPEVTPGIVSNQSAQNLNQTSEECAIYRENGAECFRTDSNGGDTFSAALNEDPFGLKIFDRATSSDGTHSLGFESLSSVSHLGSITPKEPTSLESDNLRCDGPISRRKESLGSTKGLDIWDTNGKLRGHSIAASRYASRSMLSSLDPRLDVSNKSYELQGVGDSIQNSPRSDLKQRIRYISQYARNAGFDDLGTFLSFCHTEDPAISPTLDNFQREINYEELMKPLTTSSELVIVEEFDRLTRKTYNLETDILRVLITQDGTSNGFVDNMLLRQELKSNIYEVVTTLKYELPNLMAFTRALLKDDAKNDQQMRLRLFFSTIKLLALSSDNIVDEGTDWIRIRAAMNAGREKRD